MVHPQYTGHTQKKACKEYKKERTKQNTQQEVNVQHMTKINIGNQRGKTQPFIAILIIKSLIKRGRWYMTAIAVER